MKKLDDLLGKVRSKIRYVGIELEGGWRKLPKGISQLVHDGSVQFGVLGLSTGEINSPPIALSEKLRAKQGTQSWQEWIKAHYPSDVNNTCGLHIHVSFRSDMTYQRLMDRRLTDETIRLLYEWATKKCFDRDHPIWERLKGSSRYCTKHFYAGEQAKCYQKSHDQRRPGNRYTMWNYCWGLHKTAECRVLPMFQKVEESIEALQLVMDIVNAFLVATAKREVPQESIVVADETALLDQINLQI